MNVAFVHTANCSTPPWSLLWDGSGCNVKLFKWLSLVCLEKQRPADARIQSLKLLPCSSWCGQRFPQNKLSEGEERMQLWRLWLEEHTFQQCDLRRTIWSNAKHSRLHTMGNMPFRTNRSGSLWYFFKQVVGPWLVLTRPFTVSQPPCKTHQAKWPKGIHLNKHIYSVAALHFVMFRVHSGK